MGGVLVRVGSRRKVGGVVWRKWGEGLVNTDDYAESQRWRIMDMIH